MGAKLKIAEIFAGLGGVTRGFLETERFETVFLNDLDPSVRRMYLHNFPEHESLYECCDIASLDTDLIDQFADGQLDGLLGCPPCQGFSSSGFRDPTDDRNNLVLQMGRIAKKLTPKFVLIENVPALLRSEIYSKLLEMLSEDYKVTQKVLNAAEYGVPQLRRRAVIFAIRKELGVMPTLPDPEYGMIKHTFEFEEGTNRGLAEDEIRRNLGLSKESKKARKRLVTVGRALRSLPSTQTDKVSGESSATMNHTPWNHSLDLVDRMSKVEPGFCPVEQGRNRNRNYFSQAYARLHYAGMSRTITTNFHNPGSGRYTHYQEPRTLTIREALRIQSFPDDYVLPESENKTDHERAVGNAFPPLLAKKLAEHVLTVLP